MILLHLYRNMSRYKQIYRHMSKNKIMRLILLKNVENLHIVFFKYIKQPKKSINICFHEANRL